MSVPLNRTVIGIPAATNVRLRENGVSTVTDEVLKCLITVKVFGRTVIRADVALATINGVEMAAIEVV